MVLPHITDVKGIGQSTAEILSEHAVNTVEDLARIDIDRLIAIPGFSGTRAAKIINEAQALLGADETVGVGVVQPEAMESSDRAGADEEKPESLELSKKVKKTKKGKQAKKRKEKKKKKLKPEEKKKSGKGKKSRTKEKKKKKK
jgi:transcription termination factor NusA